MGDQPVTVERIPADFLGTASFVISGFNPEPPRLLSRRIVVLGPGLCGSWYHHESSEWCLVRFRSVEVQWPIEMRHSSEAHVTQPKHFLTTQLPDWAQYRDILTAEPDLVAAVHAAAETTNLESVLLESVVSQEWLDWVDAGVPQHSDDPELMHEDEA